MGDKLLDLNAYKTLTFLSFYYYSKFYYDNKEKNFNLCYNDARGMKDE